MPNLNTKPLTNPDALVRIRRESLLAWLAPAADYFAERGAPIPVLTSTEPVDYDKLVHVFVEADESMPGYLADSLFIIVEMADDAGMDAILDAVDAENAKRPAAEKLDLKVGDDPDPADVAVQAWLLDKDLLEEIHNQHQLTRPRSFTTFVAEVSEPPDFVPPTAEQIAALEARLAAWFGKKKRG